MGLLEDTSYERQFLHSPRFFKLLRYSTVDVLLSGVGSSEIWHGGQHPTRLDWYLFFKFLGSCIR